MWRKLGREGQGSREMRQGKRSTLLTSSLEDLDARGAAVAVEEGDGNWAWDPSAVPGADPSSKGALIPVPSPATCPMYCPHQTAGPMKFLIRPAGCTVPAPSHPAPQPGPRGAPSPVPCTHTPPAAGTVTATAARRAFHGTAWWCFPIRVLSARVAAPYNPLPTPPQGESDVTTTPSYCRWNSCGALTCLSPSIIHGDPHPVPFPLLLPAQNQHGDKEVPPEKV